MRAQPAAVEPHPTLSLEQFAVQLETLASAIAAADASAAGRLVSSIPAAENVVVDRGTVEVRLDWLRAALRASGTDPH